VTEDFVDKSQEVGIKGSAKEHAFVKVLPLQYHPRPLVVILSAHGKGIEHGGAFDLDQIDESYSESEDEEGKKEKQLSPNRSSHLFNPFVF